MQLATITIQKKKIPIHFGFNVLSKLSKELNIDYAELVKNQFLLKLENQILLIKFGLEEGYRKSSSKEDLIKEYTIEDIADILDNEPNIQDDAIVIYIDQMVARAAKRSGVDEKKLKAEVDKQTEKIMKAKN